MGKEEGDLCSMTINILSRTMQQYMCFLDKMLGRGTRQRRREKLPKALKPIFVNHECLLRSSISSERSQDGERKRIETGAVMKSRNLTKVLGKVCPRCRQIGSVLYETESRIVYECPGRHQYETRKWQRGSRRLANEERPV